MVFFQVDVLFFSGRGCHEMTQGLDQSLPHFPGSVMLSCAFHSLIKRSQLVTRWVENHVEPLYYRSCLWCHVDFLAPKSEGFRTFLRRKT